jgi:hypothetical protein
MLPYDGDTSFLGTAQMLNKPVVVKRRHVLVLGTGFGAQHPGPRPSVLSSADPRIAVRNLMREGSPRPGRDRRKESTTVA